MQRLITDDGGALRLEEMTAPDAATADQAARAIGIRDRVAAYVALTKPRIIELLLVTTVPAMILAANGWPSTWLVLATLVGGALSAGGANAINCYLDRDIDEVMPRTRRRPLPMHRIAPGRALVFGIVLGVIAFAFLWVVVNPLSALLTTAALLFYVVIYTWAMKRSTPQNIVIGGAAGAMPVLVGWSAVTGTIEAPALAMFAIIFYWTPPHFWSLAMRYEKEYRAAGVPMMPVVYGREETTKHILLYSVMQFAVSLVLFSVARLGLVYLTAAIILNGIYLVAAFRLYRNPIPTKAWSLFRYSIYFLSLLFLAIAADVLIASLY